jgi:hypothetical protein
MIYYIQPSYQLFYPIINYYYYIYVLCNLKDYYSTLLLIIIITFTYSVIGNS